MAAEKKEAVVSDIGDSAPTFKLAPTPLLSDGSGSDDGYDEEKNPFRDPKIAQHWKEVYEACTYECRHVFDPNLTWSEDEEKKLIRKVDWRVCLWAVSSKPSHQDVRRSKLTSACYPVCYVLRPASRPRESLSGSIGQHAGRPRSEHEWQV